MDSHQLWNRFKAHYFFDSDLDFALDISRMDFPDDFLSDFEPKLQSAYAQMDELEAGAIKNPDENRRVGHYWLRAPQLAPEGIGADIEKVLSDIETFAQNVHDGTFCCERGDKFKNILIIGIGGSALGPQFVTGALSNPGRDKMGAFFFDNTDPDGIERTLSRIGDELGVTLTIVISKSGGTKETRNGMLEAAAAYTEAGLHFGHHAVAITEAGSQLDKVATHERWLARFPMFDWVGGRTSELSAVGMLPAALQGFDIRAILQGAAQMDELTRSKITAQNPAALMAAMWHFATNGKGEKDMVVLPYKDRLELFARYLQQLVMESLGKAKDLNGNVVHQGIAVYGNKGSTDQHAYVQQLRDGVPNFFAVFIEVLNARQGGKLEVEPGVTAGDYLSGFLYGTRRALYEGGRDSITLTLGRVDEKNVGMLIALFERAVGFYGFLVNVNAYHQPGVEAGKKAAQSIIEMQNHIFKVLESEARSAEQIAVLIGAQDKSEDVFHILRHLAANGSVEAHGSGIDATFSLS
ncbi:glucose-6-phosphate isomerase [Abditibacterium utsteinense]|uniref:Glucose-6-phosphate isomerase n=1 Tax=Abditibacterium utsteinense TaxID=1960156 RepID=A0A2S8STT9_9BACT|nr:glucose-6-phosphate isomerase [Abditibacterium utsteinense]PQV64222.1 glucose-6-phosphate isomerase [Abditibacterium utsteinense]